MLVSIIVPIYNADKFIDKCIGSILRQSYNKFELILINDGSTDESGDVCQKFASQDSRIMYIKQVNQGVSCARNRGLALAKGEYLCFVDADDWLEENAVEEYLRCITSNDADMIISERIVHTTKGVAYTQYDANCMKDRNSICKALLMDNIGNHVTQKMFKKEVWNGIVFPQGLVYEDFYIFPSLLMRVNKIAYLEKNLYNYNRMNESSITSASNDFNAFYRYSKFLAYVEHLKIGADLGMQDVVTWAQAKAIHEVVKTFCVNYGKPCLERRQLDEIRQYLCEINCNEVEISTKDRALIWSILSCPIICKIYGKIKYGVFSAKLRRNS